MSVPSTLDEMHGNYHGMLHAVQTSCIQSAAVCLSAEERAGAARLP